MAQSRVVQNMTKRSIPRLQNQQDIKQRWPISRKRQRIDCDGAINHATLKSRSQIKVVKRLLALAPVFLLHLPPQAAAASQLLFERSETAVLDYMDNGSKASLEKAVGALTSLGAAEEAPQCGGKGLALIETVLEYSIARSNFAFWKLAGENQRRRGEDTSESGDLAEKTGKEMQEKRKDVYASLAELRKLCAQKI